MKIEEVEKLLAAYYDGRTTEDEERALRSYFETQVVPDRLLIDKKLFLSFRTECPVEVPAYLEAKLTGMIDAKAQEEKTFLVKNKSRRNWKWIGGIAAGILFVITFGYGVINFQSSHPKDTYTNPEDAYLALRSVFMEMSVTMNNGIDQLAESRQEVSQINKEIKEEIYN